MYVHPVPKLYVMEMTMSDWRVRVYNDDDSLNSVFIIKDRTEREADKEAMHEVEQQYAGLDWSITECDK